jgi:hypothetical protein
LLSGPAIAPGFDIKKAILIVKEAVLGLAPEGRVGYIDARNQTFFRSLFDPPRGFA